MFEAPPTEIIITASRAPEQQSDSAASVTIIDAKRIERLGEPQVAPLLRLIPSVAVATSGPAGSLTEVRIRGAEANHTLLFVDGIRANDPAAGNTPRFELLNADIVSRIEVVRGPQSALWGSEAIGGVVAVDGPADAAKGQGGSAAFEAGSFGFVRRSDGGRRRNGRCERSGRFRLATRDRVSTASTASGDRDGYRNLAARLRASWTAPPRANTRRVGVCAERAE